MTIKSLWGFDKSDSEKFQSTEEVHRIMDEQCNSLAEYTGKDVFAVFGEIKADGSIFVLANKLADIYKNVAGLTDWTESVGDMSTKNKIDARDMYWEKRYGFEVCTEKYRFRVFDLIMRPIYPIEICIENGVLKNIKSRLEGKLKKNDGNEYLEISDETDFINVLEEILQDRKVHYIISELKKREHIRIREKEIIPDKVIICEGRTDEVILYAIAQKLQQQTTIVVADGRNNIPVVFERVKEKNQNVKTKILIVADADGKEQEFKDVLEAQIGLEGYELAIINEKIEDWFGNELKGFSKLRILQSATEIVNKMDFKELEKEHSSFKKVITFLQERV